jgi:hypothetical protein
MTVELQRPKQPVVYAADHRGAVRVGCRFGTGLTAADIGAGSRNP